MYHALIHLDITILQGLLKRLSNAALNQQDSHILCD